MERYELTLRRVTKVTKDDAVTYSTAIGGDNFEEVIAVRGGARIVLAALEEISDELGATTAGDPVTVLHAPVGAVSISSEALQDASGFAGAAAAALAPPTGNARRKRRTKAEIAADEEAARKADQERNEPGAVLTPGEAAAEVAPPPAAEAWPASASMPGAPASAVHVPPAPAVAGPPPGFNPFG
jgi:hypothetical protein